MARISNQGISRYFPRFTGDLIDSFTNDDEIHCRSTNGFFIIPKGFIIHAMRDFLDFRNGIEYVADTIAPVSRRHRLTPSEYSLQAVADG